MTGDGKEMIAIAEAQLWSAPRLRAAADTPSEEIVRFVREVEAATPKQITDALSLSHATVKQACRRLAFAGWLETDGRGTYFPGRRVRPALVDPMLERFMQHMVTRKLSPTTIQDRAEVLIRLIAYLGAPLLSATPTQLGAFQAIWGPLAPATVDIYTRHVRAFYRWAVDFDHLQVDPTRQMVTVRVRKGLPHPTRPEDLKVVFACAPGGLRMAYVLAAFAGLRRGEICRLAWRDTDLRSDVPTALINGKGGKERIVPLLPAVVDELTSSPRVGTHVVNRNGQPYPVEKLSTDSHYFLQSIGVDSTLHSMRHAFATAAVKLTRDPLLVRDLLGHSSVSTTEIYMQTSLDGAHGRLAGLTEMVAGLRGSEPSDPVAG